MQLIDPGLPDWKGNVLKHLSTAQLNLARMDMEENRYHQPCFRDFTYQNDNTLCELLRNAYAF